MVVTWLAGLGRIKADEKNGNGNENFSISDDGVWQRLSRPATGRRERGVSETRRFEKRSRHTVEAWRLSSGLVGRVVMTRDRKKFPLNFSHFRRRCLATTLSPGLWSARERSERDPSIRKKSRHTVEAWRLSNGLVGRVVMTCDRKKFPLVENFLSPNFEIDGS